MCGICGIVRFDGGPVFETDLKKMMGTMKHRGPDDEGIFINENTGLGFVRLSIIDLSPAGHQPMISEDGRYVIIMNGEIYNYIELRNELRDAGYTFRSGSDTEVLLNSYNEWGEACLDRLNGMFAFVIFDVHSKAIFTARDRFGIKPFYYHIDNTRFIFASDIPAILAIVNSDRRIDDSVVFDYLVLNRTNHSEKTFFRNINKLQHGHKLRINSGEVSINRWYSLTERLSGIENNQFDFLNELSKSVELQLRSDVPVGTCLSGGLDSSAITSLVLASRKNVDLHSFSAIYKKGQRGDESDFIAEFKDTNLKLHYVAPSENTLFDDLDDFISALSEPVPTTSIYAEYKVMQLAKPFCTVILNGQGADELMAGYHYFYGYYFKDLIKSGYWMKFLNELFHYYRTHKSVYGLKSLGFALNPRSIRYFKNHDHISDTFYNHFYSSSNSILDDFYSSKNLKEFLVNHFEYKFEHHLLWADKTGMKFSMETRFPFLDHSLVEKTLSLKSDKYIKKGYNKVVMRDAFKGIMPEKIRMRKDKVGFSTPEAEWFKNEKLQNILKEIVYSRSFEERGYFNLNQCRKELQMLQKYNKYNSELWKIMNFELWCRKYID